mgnify:FL=1
MRVGNQAVIQELAERIDQADAVVIGGASGLSSAAGYDHYHSGNLLPKTKTSFMHVLIERHLIVRSICGDAACICKEIWRKRWLPSDRSDLSQQP